VHGPALNFPSAPPHCNPRNLRSLKCVVPLSVLRGTPLARQGPPIPAVPLARVLDERAMLEKFAPPEVAIRRYPASRICDVVVVVRGQEMVLRCPSYSQAMKWARLECKSYKIPEPDIDFSDNLETRDVPLFLRPVAS
jgi:hypothetical protein